MGDTIKIKNIPGISDAGTAIKNFADSVEAAGNETQRSFAAKTHGAEMEALNAFLEKLNQLQSQVLDQAPEALRSYATLVSNLSDSLKGAGFNVKAWTSASGVETVKSKLTGEQATKISDVKKSLQDALNTATALLEIDDVNLDGIVTAAESALQDESNTRQRIHDSVQSAHDSFESGLNDVIAQLQTLKAQTEAAQGLTLVSAKVILNSIRSGVLSADKLYYLDVIRNEADAKMISVIISEGEDKKKFFEKIAQTPVNDVNKPVMVILAQRVYQEIVNAENGDGELPNVEAFMNMVGQHDKGYVNIYAAKLSAATDDIVKGLSAQAEGLYPPMPGAGSSPEAYKAWYQQITSKENQLALSTLNRIIQRYGKLNTLYQYMTTSQFGPQTTTLRVPNMNGGYHDETYTTSYALLKKGSLKLVGNELSFTQLSRYGASSTDVSAKHYNNVSDIKNASNLKELEDFRNKKENLWAEKAYNIGKSFIKDPALNALIGIVETSIQSDDQGQATLDIIKEGAGLSDDKYSKLAGNTVGIGKNILDYFVESNELDKKIEAKELEVQSNVTDAGGYTIDKEGKVDSSTYTPNYDLGAHLRTKDLEDNGLRGDIYRQAYMDSQSTNVDKRFEEAEKELRKFDNEMKAYKDWKNAPEGYTKKIHNFFAGSSKDSLADIGYDNYSKVIGDMIGKDSNPNYPAGLDEHYTNDSRSSFDKFLFGRGKN
ncbi:hypothetical protein [Streptococcus oricebi]|uniref:LXG domain-containing protein n=1 Tax=Streptococcus oricebi TaxID=1547447 RepID=A0ABS5B616_9STRE|nr:hypothetical protein [Streptococcus oricebi]MBP2623898.1 hypothetical protein [Streptococcus oricebi]